MKIRTLMLLLFFNSSILHANWGYYHDGCTATGNLKTDNAENIRLVNENLNIELFSDYAAVTVDYIFYNSGSRVDVKAGFPSVSLSSSNNNKPQHQVKDYKIIADDKSYPHQFIKGKITDKFPKHSFYEPNADNEAIRFNWLVSTIPFKKNENKKIQISYIANYEQGGSGVSDDVDMEPHIFRYLLSTGRVWKGPIKKLTITIRAIGVDPIRLKFKGKTKFKWDNRNTFYAEKNDFEPTENDDIIINMNDAYSINHTYSESGSKVYIFEDNYFYTKFDYSAVSSSMLKTADIWYNTRNIHDKNLRTAWVEGNPDDGIGETITLSLINGIPNQIAVFPGYGKSYYLYYANNRVAEFEVNVNNKNKFIVNLEDKLKPWHFIELPESDEKIEKIQLTIKKVYRGSKYRDTAISEISLRRKFDEIPTIRGPR